jgi:hypothetical protein
MANQSEKKHILKSNGQNKPFIDGPLKHEIFNKDHLKMNRL